MVNYEMEELVPIVGKLAEKYTAFESTSVSYEKAEQLMGAVLYCIHETWQVPAGEREKQGAGLMAKGERLSAAQAYEMGARLVEEKTKAALSLYHEILPGFDSYENQCLKDTFLNGLPEFFRWYDVKFQPQNTILTLDYPILKDISRYTGVDRIYEFIQYIRLEQIFLHKFPKKYILKTLMKHNGMYREMIENVCEIVFTSIIGHMLARKPLEEQEFRMEEYLRIQEVLRDSSAVDGKERLEGAVGIFVEKYYGEGNTLPKELTDSLRVYLNGAVESVLLRLKNGVDYGVLDQIL